MQSNHIDTKSFNNQVRILLLKMLLFNDLINRSTYEKVLKKMKERSGYIGKSGV